MNFGADGLWRDDLQRKKITGRGFLTLDVVSKTTLPDGTSVDGVQDLKAYLVEHRSDQFAKALTSKLLSYALGRSVDVTDDTTVEQLTDTFAANDLRLQPLIRAIVTSESFQTK